MNKTLLAPIAVAFGLLTGCATGRRFECEQTTDVAAANGTVVTLVDLLDTGRRLTDQYVATLPPAVRQRIETVDAIAARAAVRIAVRHGFEGLGYVQENGSGVLVAARTGVPVVLSAGHVFDSSGDDRQVWCWTTPGERLAATMIASAYRSQLEDHAQLHCPDAAITSAELPQCASPQVGSLVLGYGYPDQCGVDAGGRTVRGEAFEGDALSPLRMVARVVDDAPLLLEPVAGAVPLGGFSGGGLFDLDGKVVGVLTGTSWSPDRDAVYIQVVGCSVDAMPAF